MLLNDVPFKSLLTGLLALNLSIGATALCHAEDADRVAAAPTQNFMMLNWVNSLGIVEQVQLIHRFCQSDLPEALPGLITALNSNYPLARRKAAHGLVEKIRTAPVDSQRAAIQELQTATDNPDPLVQKDLVRLMADTRYPESRAYLQAFFKRSDKIVQMAAVDALAENPQMTRDAIEMASQTSPYSDVRAAAANTLH